MDEFKGDDILRLKSEYKNFVDANIRPISKEKLDELYEDIFKDREKFLEDKIEENELERRINDIDLERKNDNIESIDDRLLKMMNELNKNLEKPITISEFFEYFKNNLSTNKSSELIVNELGTLDTLPGYSSNYSLFGSDSNFVGSNLYSDINEDSFNLSEVEVNKEEFINWRSTKKVDTKLSQLEIENSLDKILKIGGYTFNYKTDLSNQHVGVIAQEIEQVLPQAVCTNSQGYLAVKYTDIIPLLINGMQDLQKEILELK